MTARRTAALAAALVLLAACETAPPAPGALGRQGAAVSSTDLRAPGAPGTQADAATDETIPEVHPGHLEPLQSLPECQPPPAPAETEPADLVVLPSQAVVTDATDDGPLQQVSGYIALAPAQILAFYLEQEGLEVLHVENEVFDAEVLVTDGQRRVFVNTQALCPQGSRFIAYVVPEEGGAALPVPSTLPTP